MPHLNEVFKKCNSWMRNSLFKHEFCNNKCTNLFLVLFKFFGYSLQLLYAKKSSPCIFCNILFIIGMLTHYKNHRFHGKFVCAVSNINDMLFLCVFLYVSHPFTNEWMDKPNQQRTRTNKSEMNLLYSILFTLLLFSLFTSVSNQRPADDVHVLSMYTHCAHIRVIKIAEAVYMV